MTDFERALTFTLKQEGGYANVAGDNGGETYRGISRNFHSGWPGWIQIDALKQNVTGIKLLAHLIDSTLGQDAAFQADIAAFYKQEYWDAAACDALPWPVNCVTFDCAVNSGTGAARKLLQLALGFKGNDVDGKIGAHTLAAIARLDPVSLALAAIEERKEYDKEIAQKNPTQQKFLINWLNRIQSLKEIINV